MTLIACCLLNKEIISTVSEIMRRYIPLLIIGLCIVFMVLATLLYTTQSVGKKEQAYKFIPVTKTLTVYTTIPVEIGRASCREIEFRAE